MKVSKLLSDRGLISSYRKELILVVLFILGGLTVAHFYTDSVLRGREASSRSKALSELKGLQEAYQSRTKFMVYWLPMLAAANPKGPGIEGLQADIKSVTEVVLETQEQFDRFEAMQTKINSRFAEAVQVADREHKARPDANFEKRQLQFEAFDRDLLHRRALYHEYAFKQREAVERIKRMNPWGAAIEPLPVFKIEEEIYRAKRSAL